MTDSLNYILNSSYNNDTNDNFIGQGSYGCTYFPGIDCSYKKNKKKYLTKIQEINFYSNNEIIISKMIKKIPKYSINFCPVLKHCLVSFEKLIDSQLELNKCETLFDELSIINNEEYKHLIYDKEFINKFNKNNKYYLFSIKFIDSASLKKFFIKINNHIDLFNNFFIIYLYLLNSIYLLNKHNIIHNDLHYENIIIKNNNNKPIIIDFGLSYRTDKMFYKNNVINLKYLKQFFMDFREDAYNQNLEKRFICFITYNKTQNHNINLNTSSQLNNLTKQDIDYFIYDAINTFKINEEISIFFTNKELNYYKTSLEKFYYKYLDKKKFKYYCDIINQLLPPVFQFEDLYKLSINYLLIYYFKKDLIHSNNNLQLILNLFIQIIKKVFHPDPSMRLNFYQINLLIKFIIKTINTIDTHDNTDKTSTFYNQLNNLIDVNKLPKNIIFQTDFAFVDFDSILNNDTIDFIKKSNIKF